jgi:hypothetical protein
LLGDAAPSSRRAPDGNGAHELAFPSRSS